MSFIQWSCERGAKSHVAKEVSGRGRRKSRRDEKGNQGVGDFRFINILQFFFLFIIIIIFFLSDTSFYPRHLPTPCPHPHPRLTFTTHDLSPLPTTHDIQLHSTRLCIKVDGDKGTGTSGRVCGNLGLRDARRGTWGHQVWDAGTCGTGTQGRQIHGLRGHGMWMIIAKVGGKCDISSWKCVIYGQH